MKIINTLLHLWFAAVMATYTIVVAVTEEAAPLEVHSPTSQPTSLPTVAPSPYPSSVPTSQPSSQPTVAPSLAPSSMPTSQPSSAPSARPSAVPTAQPSSQPSSIPSQQPVAPPTSHPTAQPSSSPSQQPTAAPTAMGVILEVRQYINGVDCGDIESELDLYVGVLVSTIANFSAEVIESEVAVTKFCSLEIDTTRRRDSIKAAASSKETSLPSKGGTSSVIETRYTVHDYESTLGFEALAEQLAGFVNNGEFTTILRLFANQRGADKFDKASSSEVQIKDYDSGSDDNGDDNSGGGSSDNDDNSSSSSGLSDGEVAGVVIAALAGLALVCLVCYYARKHRDSDESSSSGEYETVRLTSQV